MYTSEFPPNTLTHTIFVVVDVVCYGRCWLLLWPLLMLLKLLIIVMAIVDVEIFD
jgi:hypothetical protein